MQSYHLYVLFTEIMAAEAGAVRLKLSTFQYAANDPCEVKINLDMHPQAQSLVI